MSGPSPFPVKMSVVILNYNGREWLDACFASLERQTFFPEIEVIFVDNDSKDGSPEHADVWLARTGKGVTVRNGENLGYCEANNRGALVAKGEYLLFLNQDTWLEPECLERLYASAKRQDADIAAPLVLDYEDDAYQGIGGPGIDLFGFPTFLPKPKDLTKDREIFAGYGCALLVRAEMFRRIGGFDKGLFMYADETDLSWRVWIAGGRVVTALDSRLHHRGSTAANPEGKTRVVESRTSYSKRHLSNRNGLLLLLKNAQHLFLLLVIPHVLLLAAEAMFGLLLVRRWDFVRRCYWEALRDCWRMRGHVRDCRRQIRAYRQRSDFWMLRFLGLVPARWQEVLRVFRLGLPKVVPK